MKKYLFLAGLLTALASPALADSPSIPVWSGAPIATPGDGKLAGMNPTATHDCHGGVIARNG